MSKLMRFGTLSALIHALAKVTATTAPVVHLKVDRPIPPPRLTARSDRRPPVPGTRRHRRQNR